MINLVYPLFSKYYFRNFPVILAYSIPCLVIGGSFSSSISMGISDLALSALSPCLITAQNPGI